MGIDTYSKEKVRLEKEENKKAGIEEEPEDTLTIKEVLASREQSALLGDMIEHDGTDEDKELMARVLSGKMEAADIDRLSKFRGDFSEKIREAETIKEELTPELAKEMAAQHPEIKKIVETVGPDGVVKAVHETIKKMAMTDPKGFDKISKQVETVKSFKKGEIKELNDKVEEICKKQGVNPDNILKAMAIEDEGKRQKAITEIALKDAGFWKMITSGGRISKLMNMKGGIDDALAQLDQHKKDLGRIMATTMRANGDMIEALNREMVGVPKQKEVFGLPEIKKNAPTETGLREKFKEQKKRIANWDTLDEAGKNGWRDKFLKEEKLAAQKNNAEKQGFWAIVFNALFDSMFDTFDKKTLN